jgi:hypothetical protein
VTDGVTVTSLSASHLQKLSAATDGWSMPNRVKPKNRCVNSEGGVGFLVALKWNRAKRNRVKRDLSILNYKWLKMD